VNNPDFSVVVPLYNEAGSVAILQKEIIRALTGCNYELIMVDDGSTDGTRQQIGDGPNVRVLHFKKNAGQSAALLAGMRAARGRSIVLLDGDLQNDPHDIPRLLAEIEGGADLVCGYRAVRKDTLLKRLSSWIANFVRSRFVGDGVRDTGCTLKAMRSSCVQALVPFKGVHRFIPAFVKSAGFKVVEIPVNHRPRRFGASKYSIRSRALRATLDMLGVRWLQSRRLDLVFTESQPVSTNKVSSGR
jgi:dolichol-phosphate mannosyltransferase